MNSRALAFDTTDTIIVGEGTVNLRDETLDLLLMPRPKDRSLLTQRSPLVVGGPLKDPSFRPDLRSDVHTSEPQSLMPISSAVFCMKQQHSHFITTTPSAPNTYHD